MTELLGVDELPDRAVVDLEAALGVLTKPAQFPSPLVGEEECVGEPGASPDSVRADPALGSEPNQDVAGAAAVALAAVIAFRC